MMLRMDFQLGRQRQQPRVQRVVQLRCHLALLARQVRAADRADEQGVAGDDEPRLVATTQFAHRQAHAVRGEGALAARVSSEQEPAGPSAQGQPVVSYSSEEDSFWLNAGVAA